MVYTLMDKLGPVRDLPVQTIDDWEEWGLEQLVENLRKYVEQNPLTERRSKMLDSSPGEETKRKCCLEIPKDQDQTESLRALIAAPISILAQTVSGYLIWPQDERCYRGNRMCFNCTGAGHVSKCKSRGCRNCQTKHNSSI